MKTNWPDLEHGVEERLGRLGYELVALQRGGNSQRPVIRLRVERQALDRPVSLDDCAVVSRDLEGWLDRDGGLSPSYVLEVSSPGLERPLTRDKDFQRFRGRRVAVRGSEVLCGRASRLEGELLGLVRNGDGSQAIRLRLNGGDEVEVPRAEVRGARLVHEWTGAS